MYSDKHPIQLESDYPYTSGVTEVESSTCSHSKVKGKVSAGGFSAQMLASPEQLKIALQKGPVIVVVDGGSDMFGYYQSGIITDGESCGTDLTHEVTAVGYSMNGPTPYFIVRNSWGDGWGLDGYVHIAMEEGIGVCAV